MCFEGLEQAEESRVFENLQLNVESLRKETLSLLSTLSSWVIPEELIGVDTELTIAPE